MSKPLVDGGEPLDNVNVRVPRRLRSKARDAGLNLSALLRIAIEDALAGERIENWSARAKRLRALRNVVLSTGAYHEKAVEMHRKALKDGKAPKWEVDAVLGSHEVEHLVGRAAAHQLEEEMDECRRLLATSRSDTSAGSSGRSPGAPARSAMTRTSANSIPAPITGPTTPAPAASAAAGAPRGSGSVANTATTTLDRPRVGRPKRPSRKHQGRSAPSGKRERWPTRRRSDVGP